MKKRPKYTEKIFIQISEMSVGEVFTAADFSTIANMDAINKALSRLNEEGKIRRIMQGIYDFPEYSELLQEYSTPRIDKVAMALARKFNWTIAPSGDTALNILHLSTQVPNVWEFVSDGPYRNYNIGNFELCFKRRANKDVSGMNYLSLVLVESIKTIGKEGMNSSIIKKIKDELSPIQKKVILEDCKTTTSWVYEFIKIICEE